MRGTVAKVLRRTIYGKGSRRNLYQYEVEMHRGILRHKITGARICIGARAAYKRLKQAHKEARR